MNKHYREKILELASKKDISKMGFREIGREIGIKYPQNVIHHLKRLREQGLLYFDVQKRQRVAQPKTFIVDKIINIPVVGSANCGQASELAQEHIQRFLKISEKSIDQVNPKNLIAIKAVGDSLNKANIGGDSIEDGDYVVVDCKKQPESGDYVLSVIDGAANFIKFFKDDGKKEIRLLSESTLDIPPIVLHQEDIDSSGYLVNGVVVRVIKK